MKKLLAYLLCVTVLIASLTACRVGDTSSLETDTVTDTETSAATDTDTSADTDTDASAATDTETEPNDHDHVDENDDEACDLCASSVVAVVDLFAINDLHGKVCDTNTQPGVDELSTYFEKARKENEHVILLSSGDMWQGGSESNLTHGRFVTDWMNELDFAAMTLGNHEYDWGEPYILENVEMAEFPILAINVYDRDTQERVTYCRPSVMVDLGEAQVGIIGAMGDCYSSISSDKVEDIYFKTGAQLTALVKEEATRLREAGADLIIYSIHDGYGSSNYRNEASVSMSQLSGYYGSELSDGYVDVVFEGHTHQRYVLKDSQGVYHLQNGGDNEGVSHVEVKVNYANGGVKVLAAEIVSSDVYDDLEDHPVIDHLLEKYADEIAKGSEVVGWNAVARNSQTLRSLVAELYYETGMTAWGDTYDIVLGGGFLSVRSPYTLAAGEVTYAELQSLMPFDNTLVLCSVKGSDLRRKFFESSNRNYYIYYGAYGREVKANLDPYATYYIVVDTYTASYAPNHLTVVATYTADVYARDLLAEYIRNGGWA